MPYPPNDPRSIFYLPAKDFFRIKTADKKKEHDCDGSHSHRRPYSEWCHQTKWEALHRWNAARRCRSEIRDSASL
jgi:hypothetical protein